MVGKFTGVIFTFVIITVLKKVECLENRGQDLSCWPAPVKYTKFPVRAYYSSRTVTSQLLRKNTVLDEKFDFDPNRKTAVIIHGFISHPLDANMNDTRDALLLREDLNVFVLDYHEGVQNPILYQEAAANTEVAARGIYDLILKLTKLVNKPVKDWKPIHFIGHSLGAHVAGQTAALIQKGLGLTIDRITGLDPAQPCFDDVNSPLRLKKSVAKFVDIIHTDGALKKNERFGLLDPIGHADFYVNGGSTQPGCASPFYDGKPQENNGRRMGQMNHVPPKNIEELLNSFVNVIEHVVLRNGLCHHDRAVKLFIESIIQDIYKKCNFWGHPWHVDADTTETSRILSEECDSSKCVEMGINADLYDPVDATYYVKTNSKLPYCAN